MNKEQIPFKSFKNGLFALNYIQNINCNKCNTILVYTDQNMPIMEGQMLADKLRQMKKKGFNYNFKIILISAEDYSNEGIDMKGRFDEI